MIQAGRTDGPRRSPFGTGIAALVLLAICLSPPAARAEAPLIITGEVRWEGTVELRDDVLITETGRLTVAPGTQVVVHRSEGTRTDPHFYSTETEIVVRGRLEAGGSDSGTVFRAGDESIPGWGGITLDAPTAVAALVGVTISGAESGLTVIAGNASLTRGTISGCIHGLTLFGGAATLTKSRVTKNDFGLADYTGRARVEETEISGNRERDRLAQITGGPPMAWYRLPYLHTRQPGETEYLGDQSIDRDTVWNGRVVIRGQVAVQAGATLTIAAGTEVAFRRLDTNGDGLGESTLIILGNLRVEGSADNWVLFTSAEKEPRAGDWDKVSLISSESDRNLVSHARFEYGYQAFHNHFSTARLESVIFSDNYRGVQFQESARTVINGGWFTRNRSAMRFRDSNVELTDCLVEENVTGINYLRCRASLSGLVITRNLFDPLLGRESETTLSRSVISWNRQGPRFKGDGSKLTLRESAVHHNFEDGLSLSGVQADIATTLLVNNGLDGLAVTGGAVQATRTSFAGNRRWAVDIKGPVGVQARECAWGVADDEVPRILKDGRREAALGKVEYLPIGHEPKLVFPDLPDWTRFTRPAAPGSEPVLVVGDCALPPGTAVQVKAGTTFAFAPLAPDSPFDRLREHPDFPGGELIIRGGEVYFSGAPGEGQRIRFVPAGDAGAGSSWGAVNVEGAGGIEFTSCDFSGARTALHVRDADGRVSGCTFTGNEVGLRFNTAKLLILNNRFEGNATGLRFHFGEPEISGNLFRANGVGIFISDDPGRHVIRGNDFVAHRDYAVSLGEPVELDVTAMENWWGTGDEKSIEAGFFDRARSPHLGRVVYKPYALKPFTSNP